jgi:Lrp/AsnC family leucine-responsive transcriptional regulator
MTLDNVDLKILDELQRDGSLSNVALAKRIGLSPSPCFDRV